MIFVDSVSFENFLREAKIRGLDYELIVTSTSRRLKTQYFKVLESSSFFTPKGLGHIKRAKEEMLRLSVRYSDSDLERFNSFRLDMFAISPYLARTVYRNELTTEVDFKNAFWVTAYRLGLLTEDTYRKFLEFKTKAFRLIAIGSLAKHELHEEYSGEKLVRRFEVEDKRGVLLHRMIASTVADEMYRVASRYEEAFRFFWFDNAFYSPFQKIFETSYEYRTKEARLEYRKERFLYQITVDNDRKFLLPHRGEAVFNSSAPARHT